MSFRREKIKWLAVFNRNSKIAFLPGRTFFSLLITGIISVLILIVTGTISAKNWISFWLMLFIFANIFTQSGIDNCLDLLKSNYGKNKDWIEIFDDPWIPQEPHKKFNKVKTIDGFTGIPFANFSDLDTILPIETEQETIAAILSRDRQKNFYAQIPLILEGIHPENDPGIIAARLNLVSDAFKDFPASERLEIVQSCRSNSDFAVKRLEELGDRAVPPVIGTIDYNQAERTKELTQLKIRQNWEHLAFCTWHEPSRKKYIAERDFWGFCAFVCQSIFFKLKSWLFGINAAKKIIYANLGARIYREGYLSWINLFKKSQLKVRPMLWTEVWEYFWYTYNPFSSEPRQIPFLVRVKEDKRCWSCKIFTAPTANKYILPQTLISTLLRGTPNRAGTPSAKAGTVAVRVAGNYCGIAYLSPSTEDKQWYPEARLKLFWNILSELGDASVKVQVELADKLEIQNKLIGISSEASNFERMSSYFGDNYNTYDNLGESSREARSRLDDNSQLYKVVVEVHIYRDCLAELELAFKTLCESTFGVNFEREEMLTAQRWLEGLPINNLELIGPLKGVATRNPIICDSLTLPGYLPLAKPKDVDNDGVEFLYQTKKSGYPIFVNPFKNYSRICIAGKSGSGKSGMLVRLITYALSISIPVIIIDLSEKGTGTYQLYVKCLGKYGAFIDLLEHYFNPLEPPYWQDLDPQTIAKRLGIWQSDLLNFLMEIWSGGIHNDKLIERIRIINTALLRAFLEDRDVDRLFKDFWQYGEQVRSLLPTLPDLKKYLSIEKLKLQNPRELDNDAIDHIRRAIEGIENDPILGKALCNTSTISFNPMISVFAFSSITLTSTHNSRILSSLTNLATTKLSLSHRKAFLILEEFSRLSKSIGFEKLGGDNFNMGRKEERICAVVVQDLEDLETCGVSSNILSNFDYCFIGKTNPITVNKYRKIWQVPDIVIDQICGDGSNIDRANRSSLFILGYENYHIPVRSFSSSIETVLTTTHGEEKHHLEEFLARPEYSSSLRDTLNGVIKFASIK